MNIELMRAEMLNRARTVDSEALQKAATVVAANRAFRKIPSNSSTNDIYITTCAIFDASLMMHIQEKSGKASIK